MLKIELETSDDYCKMIAKYYKSIKNIHYDKYDMLLNINSKFLVYNFNNWLRRTGKSAQLVRHTVIKDDDYTLTTYWLYFVDITLEISQSGLELGEFNVSDRGEYKIISDTINDLKFSKKCIWIYIIQLAIITQIYA